MKTLALIVALSILPFYGFTQKGHGKGHGNSGKGNYRSEKSYKGEGNKSYKTKAVIVSGSQTVVYKQKGRKGPPPWAPAHGYRHRHVYFPQYQCYYDNYDGVYIYYSGARWIRTYSIPSFMIGVNLSAARIVELNMDNVVAPQINFEQHIVLYPPFP